MSTLKLPAEFRTKVLAGWHFHLDALATLLAGGSTDMVAIPGWEQIHTRRGAAFAACFTDDGVAIGFDGSQHTGRSGIGVDIRAIFDNHPTASYVAKVKRVRLLGPHAAVLWAIAGLVPPGQSDVKPEVNAVQTLTAEEQDGEWRIVAFQNTPAQFHGRPELVASMTEELRHVLRSSPAR